MRLTVLHNNRPGHDKLYEVSMETVAPSPTGTRNVTTYNVRVRWGRRPAGFSRLPSDAPSMLKAEGVSLACALDCFRSCVNTKVAGGYRIISQSDGQVAPGFAAPRSNTQRNDYNASYSAVAATADIRSRIDNRPQFAPDAGDDCGAVAQPLTVVSAADYWRKTA